MPPRFEVLQFRTSNDLALTVVEHLKGLLDVVQTSGTLFVIGLSGGRIARILFQEWTKAYEGRSHALEHLHFFFADERCVPPTSLESNFGLAEREFFTPLKLKPEQIHRIRGEDPPALAARNAEKELGVVAIQQNGVPVIDLLFLGMGEDGHVASLFPGTRVDKRQVYAAVTGPKPPPNRVTLTYPSIMAARRVWVLASGGGKDKALRQALQADPRLPLGRVLAGREHTVIYYESGDS